MIYLKRQKKNHRGGQNLWAWPPKRCLYRRLPALVRTDGTSLSSTFDLVLPSFRSVPLSR